MARITVDDCLENVDNRFELVMVTAHRAKKLLKKSAQPLIEDYRDNREVVTALREIADGVVKPIKVVEQEVEIQDSIDDLDALAPAPVDAEEIQTELSFEDAVEL
jgi:DNA-directed RNA polymerase subunit omega